MPTQFLWADGGYRLCKFTLIHSSHIFFFCNGPAHIVQWPTRKTPSTPDGQSAPDYVVRVYSHQWSSTEEEGRPQRRNRSRRRRNRGNRPEGGSTSRDRQPVTVADFISRADSQSRQNLSGKEESTQHVSRPKENGTSTSKEERTPSKRSPSNGVPSSGETVALVNGVS
ncbi:fragile X mental retardation syndrome-related protein 2-like isoform X2 [Megalobrama amblycephala]|uniref:fragile X mental retardation syndrome-related protein 2-like isoform X2 n=1 Tax=Megalobrama amblycephala TaxID=75352 RepID=UPI002013D34A|nr:fragile X mental retardation syndrome-related protein 2-like isoform X2 [Megalobrama amblycephala]